jgi:hypothetical protein
MQIAQYNLEIGLESDSRDWETVVRKPAGTDIWLFITTPNQAVVPNFLVLSIQYQLFSRRESLRILKVNTHLHIFCT